MRSLAARRTFLRLAPLLALAAGIATACAPDAPPALDGPADPDRGEVPLDPAEGIQVQVAIDQVAYAPGAPVRVRISLRNSGNEARTLSFRDGQRVDAAIEDESGVTLVRWSDDQMFTQVLGEESLPGGGEERAWEIELVAPDREGSYLLRGWVTADGVELETGVPLQVTADGALPPFSTGP